MFLKINCFLLIIMLWMGCGSHPNPPQRTAVSAPPQMHKIPKADLERIQIATILNYFPKEFVIKTAVYGNLNGDDLEDVLLILDSDAILLKYH